MAGMRASAHHVLFLCDRRLPANTVCGRWCRLLENPCARVIAIGDALWLQTPARRRETVGILELAGEVRAVGKARLVGDVGHGSICVLDQPVGIAHTQLTVERSWTHANVLPAKTLELASR